MIMLLNISLSDQYLPLLISNGVVGMGISLMRRLRKSNARKARKSYRVGRYASEVTESSTGTQSRIGMRIR